MSEQSTAAKVVAYIEKNPGTTARRVAQALTGCQPAARYVVKRLVEFGVITYQGHYKLHLSGKPYEVECKECRDPVETWHVDETGICGNCRKSIGGRKGGLVIASRNGRQSELAETNNYSPRHIEALRINQLLRTAF